MPEKAKPLEVGYVCNMLTVTSTAQGAKAIEVRCECGTVKTLTASRLRRRTVQSCGCKPRVNNKNRKPIDQLTLDGVFIKRHESISLAAQAIGCNAPSLTLCRDKPNRTAYGFLWRSPEDNPETYGENKLLTQWGYAQGIF